jgi:hypothetical protein
MDSCTLLTRINRFSDTRGNVPGRTLKVATHGFESHRRGSAVLAASYPSRDAYPLGYVGGS